MAELRKLTGVVEELVCQVESLKQDKDTLLCTAFMYKLCVHCRYPSQVTSTRGMDDTAISAVQPDDATTPLPACHQSFFQTTSLPPQHSSSPPPSHPLLPPSLVTDTSNQENIPMDLLLRMKKDANSRRNFALKQAEKLFSSEE